MSAGVNKASTNPIGQLRHRIIVEVLTLTGDGQGGSTESWATFATIWARIIPAFRAERQFMGQIQHQRTHKILMRFYPGIISSMRINYQGRYFQIHADFKPDERNFWLQLDCEEYVPT